VIETVGAMAVEEEGATVEADPVEEEVVMVVAAAEVVVVITEIIMMMITSYLYILKEKKKLKANLIGVCLIVCLYCFLCVLLNLVFGFVGLLKCNDICLCL